MDTESRQRSEPEVRVTGTLIWYYYICRRQVWLMARHLTPDEDNSYLDLGRFIQEQSYSREKKEISLGHIKLDFVKQRKDSLVIAEVKKSSRFINSARMQLAYYLLEMEKVGVAAKGELLFPKEKRIEPVELSDEFRKELEGAVQNILRIIYEPRPLEPVKNKYCKNCAYAEFCWS
ncbi:MAG TPA: CRISPR-associated protein Cas4 [Firmicutes bacterium]|nr:CRISPR-associated protein Cas4 [Bacillota bacterium]